MRPRRLIPLLALLAVGCSRPDAAELTHTLQPGDVLRPVLSFAPEGPWAAGAEVSVGMLVRGVRPTGEGYYLHDAGVDFDRVVMSGRLTFFDGESQIGEPQELPFVHDC